MPVLSKTESRARSHAAVSSLTTSGSRRCSAAWTRARSESGVSPASTGTRSCRDHRAGVDPVVHVVNRRSRLGHPRREHVLDRVRAGERGQRRRVRVDDPAREAREEVRPEQVHVAREHDEPTPCVLEPVGHRLVALLASREAPRAGTRPPGSTAASARSRARTPARFDATAAIGRSASIRACRFVPSPLTRTPITRPPTPRPRSRPRRARSRGRRRRRRRPGSRRSSRCRC